MECGLIDGSQQQWGRLLLPRSPAARAGFAVAASLSLVCSAAACGQEGDTGGSSGPMTLPPATSTIEEQPGDRGNTAVSAPTETSIAPVNRDEAVAAIDAAKSAPTTAVARDDSIVLPMGSTWAYNVQVARTPGAIGMCVENVGTSTSCHALPDAQEGPLILGYGGAPIPVVDVWSAGVLHSIEAVLLDGEVASASAVATDGGSFAALPFSARNRPVSLVAHTDRGAIDLGLADFVGDDADTAVDGAAY